MADNDMIINALGEAQIGDRLLTLAEIESLPEREADLVKKWNDCNVRCSTDVFRFYGHCNEEGERRLDLETEFAFLANDADANSRITEFARAMGAELNVMSEWDLDEGKETQVEVVLNVFGQAVDDVDKVVERWRHEIHERGLGQFWVSVF